MLHRNTLVWQKACRCHTVGAAAAAANGGAARTTAIGSRRRLHPPKHLDIFQGAPLRLPKPRSDQFPVRVCSCPLCIINLLCIFTVRECLFNTQGVERVLLFDEP